MPRFTKRSWSALFALMLAACAAPASSLTPAPTGAAPDTNSTLTVFAAASLTDSFKEIGANFERANAGTQVIFSFAGSQALRTQIEQGAKTDVFASADTKNIDPLKTADRLASDPHVFAHNQLIVILPKDNLAGLQTLNDLTKPGIKIVLADASVPVGNYTLQALDKLSAASSYGADFKTKVLAQVVSKENDVKAVVSKVSLGESDAGVVYTTDAQVAADKLATIEIPDPYNVIAMYSIAVLKSSAHAALAQRFVDDVLSAAGQATLKKYGFAAK